MFERLLAVLACHDTTGQGFQDIVNEVLDKNGLPVNSCIADSTDGAANMQGRYNGFATKMQEQNSQHIHIWCYNHVLNLVIGDISKRNIKAANLFSFLNTVASFFRESYKRMDIWSSISKDKKNRKIGLIGETRWWSKEQALLKIFGECPLYLDVLVTLDSIAQNTSLNSDTRSTAENLKLQLLKYEVIFISQVFLKIFSITGPLSRYLQTKDIDLLKASAMIKTSTAELKKLQRDFETFEVLTKNFLSWANDQMGQREIEFDIENDFPAVRVRKVKTFFDEKLSDQILDVKQKFKVDTLYMIMDTVVTSMEKRYENNLNLCADIAIFNPRNFNEIKTNGIPDKSLTYITEKIIKFAPEASPSKIKEELTHFMTNWDLYKMTLQESYQSIAPEDPEIASLNDYDNNEEITVSVALISADTSKNQSVPIKENQCNVCRNCVYCCYLAIIKYNMFQNAYPYLGKIYQFILTLPVTQVSCERSFSILKFIKNRLRNSLSDDHLESFMIMNIEKDILYKLDNEDIINQLAASSNLLQKCLMY